MSLFLSGAELASHDASLSHTGTSLAHGGKDAETGHVTWLCYTDDFLLTLISNENWLRVLSVAEDKCIGQLSGTALC